MAEPALDAELVARLRPLPRPERARVLLTGEAGPLLASPFTPAVAAMAYLVWTAYQRARVPGNFLAGRPSYEAIDTLGSRLRSAVRRSTGLEAFGVDLYQRLGMRAAGLGAEDLRWWLVARETHASAWRALSTDDAISNVLMAVRCFDDFNREIKTEEPADAS